ncbi:3-hydroxybutyrate dehydrogenase [Sphingorhabdus lutea]|uniref:3-hydroxybutyrate dehydrogenase n=1 Tax=Sphingorhabdus lutea TaxID=1913578 RepID=A0A1L3JBF6_9SPHN|nr:3-hydroxybutyrate dehydrogenase [Sphingorhabdus lutea]APG62474.1 3-hydroxybutyrate dehydrogenase [Sphingorhabdus lutea]
MALTFLTGKTALITGSTSGIGLGYAKILAQNGANVMMNGFGDRDEINAHIDELKKLGAPMAIYSDADMTKPDEIRAMVARCDTEMGSADIVINNAGIQHVSPIDEFPDDKWDAVIAIILSSAFHVIKACLPAMKAKGWGRIINTGSMHSLVASPYKSAYNSAKHGLAGLTKTVALEVAQQGITVNNICPGYVWTPLVEGQIPDTMKARGLSREEVINDVLLANQPQKQFVQVEQLASLMLYLCRDEASAITGTNLSVDGGWTAQ